MRINDAVIGVALIIFAVAEITYTRGFPSLHGQAYGPDLFPRIIGIAMIFCGLGLIATGMAARKTTPWFQWSELHDSRGKQIDLLLLLSSLIIYIVVSDTIGFIPLSVVMLLVLLIRLGNSPLVSVLVASIATLFMHALFAKVLLVPLPWGVLRPLAW